MGENFAFELLIKVLAEGSDQESEEIDPENVAPATDLDEVLLQLALELPEADDSEQFWRLFLRRTEAVLGASDLAYLAPEGSHPLVITSLSARTAALDLGNDRLQLFFHTIERPVLVANMPQFFRSFRDDLKQAGIHWLVPLAWDGRDLGTVLLGVAGSEVGSDIERIEALFQPTARLLARFAGNNDTADWSLDLVRVLIGQREKRCFGSDKVTEAIVQQVHRLGREMGFAPEQERHLIYGCLLRDVGLVGQDDALMRSPREMISTQRQAYRLHPLEGPKLLQHLDLPQVIIDVIECHHERFNGEGFPQGLQGRQIPLAARVVTVVENYVTMITGAGGRRALTPEQAAQALRDDFGQRYDPDIVSVFLQAVESDMAVPEAVPV